MKKYDKYVYLTSIIIFTIASLPCYAKIISKKTKTKTIITNACIIYKPYKGKQKSKTLCVKNPKHDPVFIEKKVGKNCLVHIPDLKKQLRVECLDKKNSASKKSKK